MKSLGLPGRLAVDFAHDIAAGIFPGAVLGMWIVQRRLEAAGAPVAGLERAAGGLWLVLAGGLLVSVVTGIVRLRYWKLYVRSGALESKSQSAAIKHSIFVLTQLAAALVLGAII